MKQLITLFIALFIGIAAYSQTVSEYTSTLQANGYTVESTAVAPNTVTLTKLSTAPQYIVTIYKDGDRINQVAIVAVLSQIGKYSFSILEPVSLYPKYFATPQIVPNSDLLLSVEPFEPSVEIKGNQVWLSAMYKPIAPIAKE